LYIHRHFDFLEERLTAIEIKERVRSLEAEVKTRIDRLYSADEGYHTDEGQMPKELQAQIDENRERFKKHRVDVGPGIELKNQSMPDAASAQEELFQNVRPVAVLAEQDAGRLTEVEDQKKFALSKYSQLTVKCTTRFEDQWNPLYINKVFPWALCGENSGAEYPAFEISDDAEEELLRQHGKRSTGGRRVAASAVVTPQIFAKLLARRVEAQIAGDWSVVNAAHNLKMRWDSLKQSYIMCRLYVSSEVPAEVTASKLIEALDSLYKRLSLGTYTSHGVKRPLNGDISKLQYADNMTSDEKAIVGSLGKVCAK